ncbi:T6SS immunity protein Tdi1 domain-containing protein [Lysobacter humi (ex Lee et al. 2017)]
MVILAAIETSWGWTGLQPLEVVGENPFGNLIVKDYEGRYWRICPEDLSCAVVAENREQLESLSHDQEFLHDWYMSRMVEEAHERLGPLEPGRKYCLKVPGALGGEYGGPNLATISLEELIAASGHLAHQIKDLPDGAQVRLEVTR